MSDTFKIGIKIRNGSTVGNGQEILGIVTNENGSFEEFQTLCRERETSFTLDPEKCLNIVVKQTNGRALMLGETITTLPGSKGLYFDVKVPKNLEYTITKLHKGWMIKPLESLDSTLLNATPTNVTVGEGPPG
jgi:hypothetical protein